MSAQTYAFLSQPPATQKPRFFVSTTKQPQLPLPPTPIGASSKSKSIKTWIAQVQPGSPSSSPLDAGSPITFAAVPVASGSQMQGRRRSRGLSLSSVRRASVSLRGTSRVVSGPLAGLIASPGVDEMNPTTADFAALGYTSFYVSLPPTTPLTAYRSNEKQGKTGGVTGKALKRIRSLSFAGARLGRTEEEKENIPAVPQLALAAATAASSPNKQQTKRLPRTPLSPGTALRRSKHRRAVLPQNLTHELMLLQFVAGGKLTAHAGAVVGDANVPGVVVDAQTGAVWRDCWEELEYTGLLADREGAGAPEFVDVDLGGSERKGSDASMTIAEMIASEPMDTNEGALVAPAARRLDKLRPSPLNLNIPPPRIAKEVVIELGDSISSTNRAAASNAAVNELGQLKTKRSISNLGGLLRVRK